MIRWLRAVMPPLWTILLSLFIFVGFEGFVLVAEWRLKVPFYSLIDGTICTMIMWNFAACYGVYRVWAFHPAFRFAYFNWLKGTPWTSEKPLPLGPLHLVVQDAAIVAVAVGLCWPRAGLQSLVVVEVFLIAYLGTLLYAFFFTSEKLWGFAVAFCIGFIILLVKSPWCAIPMVLTYAVARIGIEASLAQFPWPQASFFQEWVRTCNGIGSNQRIKVLGWPFDRLSPAFATDGRLSLRDALLMSLLAGWWCFVFSYLARGEDAEVKLLPTITSIIVSLAAIGRLCMYCNGYVPPLSVWGRFMFGRFIIPGYDKVFAAPVLCLLSFAVAIGLPSSLGIPSFVAIPIGLTVSSFVLLGMGPSLNAWRLTGNHRIVCGVMAIAQKNR